MVNQLINLRNNFRVTLRPNCWIFIRLRRGLWISLVMWHVTRKLLQHWGHHSWQTRKVIWESGTIKEVIWECVKQPSLNKKGVFVSCSHTPGTRYWGNFLVACHMTRPIHNPLRRLMKTQRLGGNVTISCAVSHAIDLLFISNPQLWKREDFKIGNSWCWQKCPEHQVVNEIVCYTMKG